MNKLMTAIIIVSMLLATAVIVYCFSSQQRNDSEQVALLQEELAQSEAEKKVLESKVGLLEFKLKIYQNVNSALFKRLPVEEVEESLDPSKERLPEGPTNMYKWMDYRKITNKKSEQWKIQLKCKTDPTTGIRFFEADKKYFTVALGSAYGRDLGDTWEVTLDNGTKFNIMLAEYKDDGSTDYFGHPCFNYDLEACTNVVEFVIDTDYLPDRVKKMGTVSALDWCNGNIVSMKYTGRKWTNGG